MRFILLLGILNSLQFLAAQTFTEKPQSPLLVGADYGDIAFADVDGDNDQDVLITGFDRLNNSGGGLAVSTKLYINDGTGSFTESDDTPFEGVVNSSIAFVDVDGDNDQDVLITGSTRSFDPISKLYTNDGTVSFTEVMGTPFAAISSGSGVFADVDGDNDSDLLLVRVNIQGTAIARLYTNDGTVSFTEVMGTSFAAISSGSTAFADVDGDNDQDLLITGLPDFGGPVSKLYINDGTGEFIEVSDTPFESVEFGSIAFADVDGDNDQDVLLMGLDVAGTQTTS
jgi:hypothetical protein